MIALGEFLGAFCRARAAAFAAAMAALCLTGGCASPPRSAPYPHESVLSVVAELKIFLRADPYTSRAGRDLEGQNIFRVSLSRLLALEQLLDQPYQDILDFAEAECYERLLEWEKAAESFSAAREAKTALSDEAGIREEWARRLAELTREPEAIGSIDEFRNLLEARTAKLEELRAAKPAFPYESFLAVESERALEKKSLLLFANRFVYERGAELGVEGAQKLVDSNPASCRAGEHLLLLGRFHEERAQDYALLVGPATAGFELETWSKWIEAARAAYTKVAQSDGDPAKPEGQARLRALDAFAERTLQAAR